MQNTKYAEYTTEVQQNMKMWKAGLYIRLSKDDGDKAESCSVTSQREILKEYVKQHPDIVIHDIYIDDGWSGTNFNRPSFLQMISDIKSKNLNCVIVKDLSRFGRNAVDSGYYLDDFFVKHNIRFIAINNAVDTYADNMNAASRLITVGVQNVINESVAATTSVNVRASLNIAREKGNFIGSFASYGYLKDPNDHHKLIIDENTAPIVQQIFKWFIDGKSLLGITRELNTMGVPNPSMYKKQLGMRYNHPSLSEDNGLWHDSSVRRILKNQVYIGNMVQGKNTAISYKIKQCRAIPENEWIIVENTHEPIIDKDTFDQAQQRFNKNTRSSPKSHNLSLFSGLIRCADCGRIMAKKTNSHFYGTYEYYRCTTYRKMDKNACTNHTIRVDKLELAVLVTLQKMIDVTVDLVDIVEDLNKRPRQTKELSHLEASLNIQTNERDKQMKMQTDLYPDFKSGLITKEEYTILKSNIAEKIKALDEKINSIKQTVAEYSQGYDLDNEFIETFKKYGKIKKLTRPILTELVDEILIGENGNIQINLKFRDEFQQLVDYVNKNTDVQDVPA